MPSGNGKKGVTMDSAGRRAMPLHMKMLIGFLAGLIGGLIVYTTQPDAPWVAAFTEYVTEPIGQIFLRLLFMLVIPLLFSALVVGISEMGEIGSLKRIGLKTLAYTVIVSAIVTLINVVMGTLIAWVLVRDRFFGKAVLEAQAMMAQDPELMADVPVRGTATKARSKTWTVLRAVCEGLSTTMRTCLLTPT